MKRFLPLVLLLVLTAVSCTKDLYPVSVGEKVGYINGSGETVIEAIYDKGDTFTEGFALVSQDETLRRS